LVELDEEPVGGAGRNGVGEGLDAAWGMSRKRRADVDALNRGRVLLRGQDSYRCALPGEGFSEESGVVSNAVEGRREFGKKQIDGHEQGERKATY
jgi:hypothetical protein